MMFNLKIQSPYQPRYKSVMGSKICRGIYLVNGPLVFNFVGIYIGYGKTCMFHGMGQLENNADQETGDGRRNKKSNDPGSNTCHIYRKGNKNKCMKQFKKPKVDMIHY